jgi:excinuclease ABC subunit C
MKIKRDEIELWETIKKHNDEGRRTGLGFMGLADQEKKMNADKLKAKAAGLPQEPGVYLFKDAEGLVVYVGKAKSLKKRVQSYFGRELASKTVAMMANVADIEFRTTPTEAMALLLEASLVHQYMPRYNISLRDDKSFPFVKITNEDFPRIYLVRKREQDGAVYLGLYTSANLLRETLKILRRHFPYRSCKRLPKKACLYFRLSLCPAPCIGKISREEYARTMENISLILEGKTETLIRRLSVQMEQKSKAQKYEEAARIRDQISAISAIGKSRAGVSPGDELGDLKHLLNLDRLPARIEAFDISNIYGKEATGSMVSFYKGHPDKDNYRRFRIKTVEKIDDYKMLGEVVRRRYSRVMEEKLPLPDLVLIDGGKGHLLTAEKVVKELGLKISLASIAKEKEHIYIRGRQRPIKLKEDTPALNLIRRIRDEAHRFAVSYHHVLRRKKIRLPASRKIKGKG